MVKKKTPKPPVPNVKKVKKSKKKQDSLTANDQIVVFKQPKKASRRKSNRIPGQPQTHLGFNYEKLLKHRESRT